jgi:hypothetical protein
MVEAGMDGARVDQVGEGHLVDASQPLVVGMGDNIQ